MIIHVSKLSGQHSGCFSVKSVWDVSVPVGSHLLLGGETLHHSAAQAANAHIVCQSAL